MPHALDTTDVPECLSCGTCCFSNLPEFIRVFGVDDDRMDNRARTFTHFIGNRCYMRLTDGHCAALQIDHAANRFVCSIYDMRPDCCRALERGSAACRGERHEKADRPLLAVAALVRKDMLIPPARGR
jgi:hypothetical protein